MKAIIVIREAAPGRESLISRAKDIFRQAGIHDAIVVKKLRTMVAAFRVLQSTHIAAIVEPEKLARVRERIVEARAARDLANGDLRQLRDCSQLVGRGTPWRPLPEPSFLVLSSKKVPAKELPISVATFALAERDKIIAAIRAAILAS
jgi:hypothetical protein